MECISLLGAHIIITKAFFLMMMTMMVMMNITTMKEFVIKPKWNASACWDRAHIGMSCIELQLNWLQFITKANKLFFIFSIFVFLLLYFCIFTIVCFCVFLCSCLCLLCLSVAQCRFCLGGFGTMMQCDHREFEMQVCLLPICLCLCVSVWFCMCLRVSVENLDSDAGVIELCFCMSACVCRPI